MTVTTERFGFIVFLILVLETIGFYVFLRVPNSRSALLSYLLYCLLVYALSLLSMSLYFIHGPIFFALHLQCVTANA